jgi:hypothetical protein
MKISEKRERKRKERRRKIGENAVCSVVPEDSAALIGGSVKPTAFYSGRTFMPGGQVKQTLMQFFVRNVLLLGIFSLAPGGLSPNS